MKYRLIILFSLVTCILNAQAPLQKGKWRIAFQLNDSTELPFNIDVKENTIDILNAGERISIDEISYSGDSIVLNMPVFDSEIRAKISGDKMTGNFYNHARKDKNVIPLSGERKEFRFSNSAGTPSFNMTGRWEVLFAGDEAPLNISAGEFEQQNNYLTGTFLTPTGDYRYLEGEVTGNEFRLSCFDGSHLFLFNGFYSKNGIIRGHFYSGKHWHDTWIAKRNEKTVLPDPDSLMFLKSGYDHIEFTFPDADSNMVSLNDKRFQNKIVILQIMGTWCPNCMDETAFLAPFYKEYRNKGVEIIALDFERTDDFSKIKRNLLRLKKRYDIDYTMLYAGNSDQKLRSKSLPMLNTIFALPSTVFIDRNNRVRRIHTGFAGPATGEHYEKWKEDFYHFVEGLIQER